MIHLNSSGKESLGSGIAFLTIAALAVALRFYTKALIKAKWGADDWWIFLALIGFSSSIGVEFWGIFSGGGGEYVQSLLVDFATLQTLLKSLYTLSTFFAVTITATKLSILSLYRRIFIFRRFQQITLVVGGLCVIWWIVFTITSLVPCRPVKKFWQPQVPGHCYNFNFMILGVGIADVLLDASILLLPIKPILNLQMSRSRKALLCTIFLVGGFVIITGIVRIILIYEPHTAFVNFTHAELWANIHLGTAILCACLPTYRPTLARLSALAASFGTRLSSLFSRTFKASKISSEFAMGAYPDSSKRYNPLDDPNGDRHGLRRADVDSLDETDNVECDHITVRNAVEAV